MAMGGKAGEQFTDINVTPLTDVFLVLLVIMILVAPLVNISVLKVDPPVASSSSPAKPEEEKVKLDVEVTKDGVVMVNKQVVKVIIRILAARLRKTSTTSPFSLDSHVGATRRVAPAISSADIRLSRRHSDSRRWPTTGRDTLRGQCIKRNRRQDRR